MCRELGAVDVLSWTYDNKQMAIFHICRNLYGYAMYAKKHDDCRE